jgi:hypothetical protein
VRIAAKISRVVVAAAVVAAGIAAAANAKDRAPTATSL